MKKHTLTAIKHERSLKNRAVIKTDRIEEHFFSIYNLERRQRELEELGYETEVDRITEILKHIVEI